MNTLKEAKRLDDLRLYKILDTAAEKAFDDLTKVASAICGTPISLISLVDKDRQWFKSRQGLDAKETPRELAFCAHAIEGHDIMIVEDAWADKRFAENPLVLGSPNIRFYAGVPLVVESGSALGTLCVIDREPRNLTSTQLDALRVLSNAVVSQLELRRARQDLQDIQKLLPMCAWCSKVRTDESTKGNVTWLPLHEYVIDMSAVTHGICPDCKESQFSSRLRATKRIEVEGTATT